jgi:hypothetical protein
VERFRDLFGGYYDLFYDKSLNIAIDSKNDIYVSRTIREDYITGSSITVVLCGLNTWRRKHVDWEIHSTLLREHALLGIKLPVPASYYGPPYFQTEYPMPERLFDNVISGFARTMSWSEDPWVVRAAIEGALEAGKQKRFIQNGAPKKFRNDT